MRDSLAILFAFLAGSLFSIPVRAGEEPLEFNRDIRPILSDNCVFCHGPDEQERKAGLRLDTLEGARADLGGYAAIVPGKPDESELTARIHDTDPDSMMPPPDSSRRLSAEDREILKRWIEQGAAWQEHWAFEVPAKRTPPSSPSAWAINEVDRFVEARLSAEGLEPSPEASKETLIRRVTLDLTGVPPTLAEVEDFLADVSPGAYERVVDRLLRSPRFAERMTWQWLEAARYADTDGYQNDGPRDMWRWRDWVLEAYRTGMPFDRFTIEQLAGDLLENPTHGQLVATGFNRNHRYNSEAGLVLEEFLLENAVDRVDTTSTVWMGLTMACARCHDHKYDPLSQREYFQLISYFDRVPESGRAIKIGNSEPWIRSPTDEQRKQWDERIAEAEEARDRLERLSATIDASLAAWERTDPVVPGTILEQGLERRVGGDAPIVADGSRPIELDGTIAGLTCQERFSIAFRLTPETVASGAVLSNEAADTTRKGILVAFREGRLRFAIISRWIAGVGMIETERSFTPGESVHVTLTNDGTQRAAGMRILVNGRPVATRTIHNTNSNTMGVKSGVAMRVGGSKHAGPWKGRVSDLRFYRGHTLTPGEARLLAIPETVADILAMAPSERSEAQAEKLRHGFLESAAPPDLRLAFSQAREAEKRRIAFEDSLPTTMVMHDAPVTEPTRIRIRGEYHNKGEPVSPGVPEILSALSENQPDDRLGLARWLVDGDHPLTARVTVNRYWQMLFGRGLVKTAEDFGTQGSPPSHPDLLDWLAVDFVESGWDIRATLKTIVMSATYRQSSAVRSEHLAADPDNILLARAPRCKLAGNFLRDQALFVSGLLVEKPGGPSVKPYQPARLWKEASNFTYKQDSGENLYRRSLYTYWKRTLAPPSMAVLDTADREWCSVRSKSTNTPLQALTLLNETAFFEAARRLGERTLREAGNADTDRVRFAFRTVLSRLPNETEEEILVAGLADYRAACERDSALTARMGRVGESPLPGDLDPVELGAVTALANVILNLEEASVRE